MYYFLLMYILPFILITAFVESECFGWATISALVSIGVYSYFHRQGALAFLQAHAGTIFIGCGIYLVVGVVWSFVRWFFLLMKRRSQFRALTEKWKQENNLQLNEPIPPEKMSKFTARVHWRDAYLLKRPLASEHKSQIIAWMSFWPFSITGYLLNDPIKHLFTFLFDRFRGSYQKMANGILSDVEFDDRPVPPPPLPEKEPDNVIKLKGQIT